MALACEAARS